MKRRIRRLRLAAWGLALMFFMGILPTFGQTESVISDWVDPLAGRTGTALTEDNAEIFFSVSWNGTPLEDSSTIPVGAKLDADVSIRIRRETPALTLYALDLPEGIRTEETAWETLPAGRWAIADHHVMIELSEDAWDGDDTAIDVSFAFAFSAAEAGQLIFPGKAPALEARVPEYTFAGIGDRQPLEDVLAAGGIPGEADSVRCEAPEVSLDEEGCLTAIAFFDEAVMTVVMAGGEVFDVLLRNPDTAMPDPLVVTGADYQVRLYPSDEAALPENAELRVEERLDTEPYALCAMNKLDIVEEEIQFLRVFDLSVWADGSEIEPSGPVRVEIGLHAEGERIVVLHFAEDPSSPRRGPILLSRGQTDDGIDVLETECDGRTVIFETGSFSAFAVLGHKLETTVTASDGQTYQITVSYGAKARIPEGAVLMAQEIVQDPGTVDGATDYESLVARTQEVLGWEDRLIRYARFFDITILDAEGREVQPADGSVVHVEIRLADKEETAAPQVVHLGETPEVMETVSDEQAVRFDATGFSVYAVIDAPGPAEQTGWFKVSSVEELAESGSEGFYIRSFAGNYFTNRVITINTSGRTGIVKTKPASNDPSGTSAALYYFEPEAGSTNRYKIYCYDNDNNKLYIRQSSNSLSLVEEANATVFTVSDYPDVRDTFRVAGTGGYYWNMQGGANGETFAAYNNADDYNARIQMQYYYSGSDDPYRLNGKSFGIAYQDASVTAAAMMAEGKTVSGSQRLSALDLVMHPDVLDNEGVLLVAENSEIDLWTFESVQGDQYHITATVNGQKKYLTIRAGELTLEDQPDEVYSVITATPGTGTHAGKWQFTVGSYRLKLAGSADDGFQSATGNANTTWLNLVEKSRLGESEFTTFNARKVSVSDNADVFDGQELILYTRIWNDATKQYEFYVVDHDGMLKRCYDIGDSIEWVGSSINTALWKLKIYYGNDGAENNYYDFSNTQYGHYIAPQTAAGQVFSSGTIGVNLTGRQYGSNYSTIIAWDDASYSYSGLRVVDGHIEPCALADADDFYFAVMLDAQSHEHLSTVSTVDNNQYGISMKMINYENDGSGSPRAPIQKNYFKGDNNRAGLLSTNLNENGYPTSTSYTTQAGRPLSDLYNGAVPVNHLFIQSIYNESGYFEYDSTANFAHLNADGTFTVYDQLGAIGDYSGYSGGRTGMHGQFMPYDDLTEGEYCSFTNQTDVYAHELSDLNARKGERLFNIGRREEVNYNFGMELTASFTQTASGLDAWGHDIVFEFSGDDDFWLYVDGELVLDLGGVHSAMTGSVNFRTGEVKSSRGNSTLYELFKKNYQARGLSEDEIADKLSRIFEQNDAGQYVFTDYSTHVMRIFYMERGAGASNLHMRFNLAAVKPGSFLLSKKLSGTDHEDNDLIEFPYQIIYYTRADGGTMPHILGQEEGEAERVLYKDTNRRVRYQESFTPAGYPDGADPYEHVFFLKPGEVAEVNMPEDVLEYHVAECYIDPAVYDRVTANDIALTGTAVPGTTREDYITSDATLEDRPKVDYVNNVKPGAMRTLEITKKLYDVDGETLLHYPEDSTLFNLRLYLGTENDSAEDLPEAYLYSYYVKDPNGYYCRWNVAAQAFESMSYRTYEELSAYLGTLTNAEKESIIFVTSQHGSISKIPADYTVEVRDLIVGSQYKVEERNYEIPKGYTLRLLDGYTRVDPDHFHMNGDVPYSGTMHVNESPEIEVRNQKGWGLTVEKVWTDADFMKQHDPIYFAVYTVDQSGTQYTLVPDTVREMKTTESSIYYFFYNLDSNTPFDQYTIMEVNVTDPVVAADGRVTGYSSMAMIPENGYLTINGQTTTSSQTENFTYTVHYTKGEPTFHNENVRTDTVTNSRPGIELYKTDWFNVNLAGAVFTLKDQQGNDVGQPYYTSRNDGLITIAYLSNGTYTLTETVAPKDYVVMDTPMTITVNGRDVTISGVPEDMYTIIPRPDGEMVATFRMKNRQTGFKARKVDADTEDVLEGAHFALYYQVRDVSGNLRKDYEPIHGYEDLVTDENGFLTAINMNLSPRTYYLEETQAPEGYEPLENDICFTIGTDGKVTINTEEYAEWLQVADDGAGGVAYTLLIMDNKRVIDPVTLRISGVKVLNGRDMRANEFIFQLQPVNLEGEAIAAPILSMNEAAAAGTESEFHFDLTFDVSDLEDSLYHDSEGAAWFYYVVSERISEGADESGYDSSTQIYYDTNRFLVVVRLYEEDYVLKTEMKCVPYDGGPIPDEDDLRPRTRVMTARH